MPEHPDRVFKRIGLRLAEVRRRLAMTQEQAAENLGLGVRYVQRLESGDVSLNVTTLVRLANGYRIPLIDLFRAPRPRTIRRGRPRKKVTDGARKDG